MAEEKKILEKLVAISEEFLQSDESELDYQKISDNILAISGAKYAAFNLFEENGSKSITVAFSAPEGIIKKASSLLGFKLIGKKWDHAPVRTEKIKAHTITHFSTLSELTEGLIPKPLASLLEKTFNIGEVVYVKILKENVMLGEFTLIMPRNIKFKNDNYIEIYTRQVELLITRRRGEDKLIESKIKYEEVFNSIGSCIAIYEAADNGNDFIIKDFNKAAEKAEKVKREDIIGKSVLKVFPGVKDFGLFDIFKRVYKTGKPENLPLSIYKDSRISGWRESLVYKTSTGEIVAVYEDVTAKKQAEEELVLANERLSLAQKSAGAGVWDWDMNTEKLNWSPEFYIIFGLDPKKDTASFDTWRKVLHSEDRQAAEESLNESIKEHKPLFQEYRIIMPSGKTRWINAFGNTIYDEHGKALRMSGICIDITDRKKSKEALELSEGRYHDLFENMLEGYAYCRMLYDKDGHPYDWVYLDVNKKFELLTNLKDVIGKRITEIMPEVRDTNPELFELYSRVALTGQPESIEDYIPPLTRWLHISVFSPLKEYFIAVFNNVTEIHESREKVIASEEKYRTLVEKVNEAILIVQDGIFVFVNPRAQELMGIPEMDFVGKSFADFVWPEDREMVIANYAKRIAGETLTDAYDFRIIGAQGEPVWVFMSVALIQYKGKPATLIMVTNITDRKKAEEEIKSLAKFPEENPNIVGRIDYDGKLLYCNHAYKKNFAGKDHIPIKLQDAIKKIAVEKSYNQEKVEIKIDDRIFLFNLIPIKEESYINFYGSDITERKLAEQDLKRSNIDLERFAYVASHDLQEPLRMMASYATLLEKRYKDKLDSDANDFISYIVDGAKRMRQLIDDLLAFSRVGAGSKPFKNIDMQSVLKIVKLNLRLAIKESKAKITWEPLPVIKADEVQMVQIFQNLIDNAIKFRGKDPPIIHISAKQEESDWIFLVKDNGMGIDPKYFDRIFIIFQRLQNRDEYSDTGIGLAIVKRIVESYGGRAWIESGLQKGSTFYFTIPKKFS